MTDLLTTFRTRRLLCQTLLQLTDRQRDHAAAGNLGDVIEILERKTRVLSRLREGQTVVATWQSERHRLPPEQRQECETLLTECERDLRALLERTDEDTVAMQQQRDETLTRLQQLSSGVNTHDQYTNADPSNETQAHRLDLAH